jgi:FSR family fosmidomycin resistance protein-like MFS transporter
VRRLPIALIVLSHAVVDASQNVLPVVLPLLQDRFGLSYFPVGLAAALLTISSSMIQPVFGWISDRRGTQWFLSAGILWTGVLMGMVGLVPNYWMLLLVLTLTGVGTAAYHPVASMTAAQASGTQRGLGMSFFSAGGNLGFALGPILTTWLLAWFNLKGTAVLMIPGFLAAAVIHACRREFVLPVRARRRHPTQESAPIPWARLSTLCVLITLRSWGYSGLIIFLPMFLREQGVPLALAGRALFVFLFFGALGGMLGGYLSDRLGRQQVIAASLLVFPGLMSAALAVPGPLQWIFLATAGMALLASFSVTVVFAQELLPQHVGLASGLTLGLAFGAGGVGVGMSGLMADVIGLPGSMWVLAFLPGVGGVLALRLKTARPRPEAVGVHVSLPVGE